MGIRLPAGQFYGASVRTREVHGFRLTESRFDPGAVIPVHGHEAAHFCVVLEGGYAEYYAGRVRRCSPGRLILHPPGETHANRIEETGARDLSVELLPGGRGPLPDGLNLFRGPADFCGGPPVWSARKLSREFHRHDAASRLAIESLALEVLAAVARADAAPAAGGGPPRWLRRVLESLHDRLSEDLSLAGLAEEAGVHATHLARTFRRHHGCSVGEYVRRLRVEAACRQLAESAAGLADIAVSAGFCDQSHFCRVFRRQVGMTPAEFRGAARRR
jgi:AraC family transcriptional regulator